MLSAADINAIAEAVAERLEGRQVGEYIDRKGACRIIGCGTTLLKAFTKQYPEIRRKGKRGVYVRKYCNTLAELRKTKGAILAKPTQRQAVGKVVS